MARPGIEYPDVEKVARKLFSQGIHPSVQRVRVELGTGSNSTISKHLKSWQTSFSESNSPSLPSSVPDDLMSPLDEFWSTAVARAETNYQSFREELDEKVVQAETKKQAALTALEEKSAEVSDLTQELTAIKAELSKTKEALLTLQGQATTTTNELQKSHEEVARLLELMQVQQSQYDTQLKNILQAHQQHRVDEHERSLQTENRLLKEIDDLRQIVSMHEKTEQKYQQSANELNERHNQTKRDHSQAEAECRKLEDQLHQTSQQSEHLKITHEKQLESQQTQLSQSLDIMTKLQLENDTLKEEAIAGVKRFNELSSSIASLQAQLRSKENEHKN